MGEKSKIEKPEIKEEGKMEEEKEEKDERINLIEDELDRESIRKWFEVIENNYNFFNEFAVYDTIIRKYADDILMIGKEGREVDYLYSDRPGLEKQIKEMISRYKKEEGDYDRDKFHTWYEGWEINSFGDKLDKLCDKCAKINVFPGTCESYMLFIQKFYPRAKEQEEKDFQTSRLDRERFYPNVLHAYVVLPIASYLLKDIDDPKIKKELYELVLFKQMSREVSLSESQIETFKKNYLEKVEGGRADEVQKKAYDKNIVSDPKYKWEKKVVEWTAHIIRTKAWHIMTTLHLYTMEHGLRK